MDNDENPPRWRVTIALSRRIVKMVEDESAATGIIEDEIIAKAIDEYCQRRSQKND